MTARQLLLLGLLIVVGCTGRPRHWSFDEAPDGGAAARAGRSGKVLELDLTGGVPESTSTGGLLPLPASRTLVGLVRTVERAEDAEAGAVFDQICSCEDVASRRPGVCE